jgi:hypothetical protein
MHGGVGTADEHETGCIIKRAAVVRHCFGDYDCHLDRFGGLPARHRRAPVVADRVRLSQRILEEGAHLARPVAHGHQRQPQPVVDDDVTGTGNLRGVAEHQGAAPEDALPLPLEVRLVHIVGHRHAFGAGRWRDRPPGDAVGEPLQLGEGSGVGHPAGFLPAAGERSACRIVRKHGSGGRAQKYLNDKIHTICSNPRAGRQRQLLAAALSRLGAATLLHSLDPGVPHEEGSRMARVGPVPPERPSGPESGSSLTGYASMSAPTGSPHMPA